MIDLAILCAREDHMLLPLTLDRQGRLVHTLHRTGEVKASVRIDAHRWLRLAIRRRRLFAPLPIRVLATTPAILRLRDGLERRVMRLVAALGVRRR